MELDQLLTLLSFRSHADADDLLAQVRIILTYTMFTGWANKQ